MGQAMDAAGAKSIVVVIERYASSALAPADVAWAKAIHEAFGLEGLCLRGLLLSHNRGVRWIAQDDYRYSTAAPASSVRRAIAPEPIEPGLAAR